MGDQSQYNVSLAKAYRPLAYAVKVGNLFPNHRCSREWQVIKREIVLSTVFSRKAAGDMRSLFRIKAGFVEVVPKKCGGLPQDLHDCMAKFPVSVGTES